MGAEQSSQPQSSRGDLYFNQKDYKKHFALKNQRANVLNKFIKSTSESEYAAPIKNAY